VNEVVDLAKRSNRECLILKVDFEKAYDSVNWGFLEYMMRRVGMEEKGVRWMRACVFRGNMYILVNGSPTEEISVQRGLKQGDPLAPFLFLLVAEGFSGLMTNAVNRNLFKGFEVKRGGLVISHLQYADDTLCIGEPTIENLWLLKAVLRGFEMASRLKVNFHKSSLIGVNVHRDFMEATCSFLHCREGAIPFKYLGLSVGANSKKLSTWEPMLDQLKNRLNSWGNIYVSLGGRIVLLNSVLNAIPIFYLSFLNIPVKVLKKVTQIQREFLCGGVRGGWKVCWVKWRKVCQPRSKGGLGVREVKMVNLSLLAKWKWRLLQEDQPLWKRVLVDKYGDHVKGVAPGEGTRWPRFTSLWWRNLMSLEEGHGDNWFTNRLRRKIGNGNNTSFWKDRWVGEAPIRNIFPRLFSISNQKEAKVKEVVTWQGGGRSWNLTWRRLPFSWEANLVDNLMALLEGVVFGSEEDRWDWLADEEGMFSVKSAYSILENIFLVEEGLGALEEEVFSLLWKSLAPSKVVAFSWSLLLDCIPTRDNLALRRILDLEASLICVLCGRRRENSTHLFLHCDVSSLIWRGIFNWLEINFITPHNLFVQFACWNSEVISKRLKKGFWLIWHATIWSI